MARSLTERLYIGCAGWSIPRVAAGLFPPTGSHLQRHAYALSAVEINTSFYRPHRPSTYQRWAASVRDGFRFSVKMPKQITHVLQLRDASEPLDAWLAQCRHLGEKLGPLLVQLPPRLTFEAALVRNFWRLLRDRFSGQVVCEPRHPSWFAAEPDRVMADFSVARVAADPAVVPEAGLPGGYRALAYFRLHGVPRLYYSNYEPAVLAATAGQIADLLQADAEVWCIFDNTAEGAAPANAVALRGLLASRVS